MPRFAISMHDAPRGLHYDLFLEHEDSLKTWALPRPPAPGEEMECESLADHRLIYLDYEGPISGDRGTVARWDWGTYNIESWTEEAIVVELSGQKLTGRVELRRITEPERWRILFSVG